MSLYREARRAGAVAAVATVMAAVPAMAQSLPGGSGIDYYPSWMHQGSPFIPGADNDRDPLPGERFGRTDRDFEAWRAEQISRQGQEVDSRRRPEAGQSRDAWREVQGAGGDNLTRDRDLGGAEPTLGR